MHKNLRNETLQLLVQSVPRHLAEPGSTGLFTRLARVGLFLDAFQHRCLDRFGLRFIDYSALRVLQSAGPPYRASPTELSEVLLRSSGGITQILDRLESAGYVRRVPDPRDRRKMLAELTEAGRDIAQRANTAYARERRRLLQTLSDTEIDEIDAAIRLLLGAFERDPFTANDASPKRS